VVEKLSLQHSTLTSACNSLSGDKPLRAHALLAATLWLPTETNKSLLENAWEICTGWAEKTGTVFAPEKSELLHFSRAHAECTLPLRLKNLTIWPIKEARFLGVWLNNKLSWKAHIEKIKAKMKTQMLAFSKLAASAWGTSVPKARQVYAVIIRSVLAYGAPSWQEIGGGEWPQ
jgi:hypothetical protein